MVYTQDEVFDFIEQEDVKFIRLAFCDVFGNQKNVSIMPDELPKAFESGISFDASAIKGFENEAKSDLFLYPIPETLNVLPWRPMHGKVVRMFCDIRYANNKAYEKDSRYILKNAVQKAKKHGINVQFGSEFEFYLFNTDEKGYPTKEPFDMAGYMDVAPEDKGENVRREICLTLVDMGIIPESSHHEEGPGQNEIDFRYSDAVTSADNAMNFKSVVKAAAMHNGLFADFSPKPLIGKSGNGMHINMSVVSSDGSDKMPLFLAGVMKHISEMTAFLNPCEDSYSRLGENKAPKYITWSHENRSQLIRIPAADGKYKRAELRSPDPTANPYIAYALLIEAGLDGIINEYELPDEQNINLYTASDEVLKKYDKLPSTLEDAQKIAMKSKFIMSVLGKGYADFMKM